MFTTPVQLAAVLNSALRGCCSSKDCSSRSYCNNLRTHQLGSPGWRPGRRPIGTHNTPQGGKTIINSFYHTRHTPITLVNKTIVACVYDHAIPCAIIDARPRGAPAAGAATARRCLRQPVEGRRFHIQLVQRVKSGAGGLQRLTPRWHCIMALQVRPGAWRELRGCFGASSVTCSVPLECHSHSTHSVTGAWAPGTAAPRAWSWHWTWQACGACALPGPGSQPVPPTPSTAFKWCSGVEAAATGTRRHRR